MIVYNVQRRWFFEKGMAEKYRVSQGLKPAALLKLTVTDRLDLCDLLNALCEPQLHASKVTPEMGELIDRAYVETGRDIPDCVPEFLLKSHGIERNK